MTNAETRQMLKDEFGDDTGHVTYSKKAWTVRDGFFYTHGRTAADLVKRVQSLFPNATVLDSGEVWKSFRGGASLKASSHWFVTFTV